MQARNRGSWEIDPRAYADGLAAVMEESGRGYASFRGVTHSFDPHKLARRLRERKIKKSLTKKNRRR